MNTILLKPITLPSFREFAGFVMANHKQISPRAFAKGLEKMQKSYLYARQKDLFCSEAEAFATELAKEKHNDFAGIIMSVLCKITEFFPERLEPLAQKGYEIAKANGDYIHMMARLNNLRKIYQGIPDKLYDYIQVLYKQESCLIELTSNYDSAISTYHTVTRKPTAKKEYEQMLAFVQTEIAKLTRRKHPESAQKRLLSAREIFEQSGNKQHIPYIDMLLNKLKT